MKNKKLFLMRLILSTVSFVPLRVQAASHFYGVVEKISLPGEGGWDYLKADAVHRRLYISHSTEVDVFDMDQNKVIGHIANTPGVHGIAISPDYGFTSNGKDGTLGVFDLYSLKILSRVKVGDNPDAILYDPSSRRVFTFNGRSQDVTSFDPSIGQVMGRFPLGGKPEFAVTDGHGLLYDNLEDQSQLVTLDAQSLTLKERWDISPCESPSSLAIDTQNRRLFAGCGNRQMAVIDADSGDVLVTLPIGDHVDATVFDPETGMIFNSNGDGTLTVIHEDSPNDYHVVENVVTQKGARTVALDLQTHKLYLVTAQFGPTPAATTSEPHPRPLIIPGTFTLLIVDKLASHSLSK